MQINPLTSATEQEPAGKLEPLLGQAVSTHWVKFGCYFFFSNIIFLPFFISHFFLFLFFILLAAQNELTKKLPNQLLRAQK